MYQRNLGHKSLSESIVSSRSVEKQQQLNRAPSLDSLGNSSSGSMSSRENGNKVMMDTNSQRSSRRESVKMDYSNMEEYQEIVGGHNYNASVDDEVLSDVDSIEDAQVSRVTTTQVQIHSAKGVADLEFDDDEPVLESEIPKDPVVTAYLEKASHICQNNCVKSMVQFNTRTVQDEGISVEDPSVEDAIVPNGSTNLLVPASGSMKTRRTSLSSGSVGRMETIVEEPIEAKVSVKEILARFETLRESSEVNALCNREPTMDYRAYLRFERSGRPGDMIRQ